jgi:hypothetical protein
MTKEAKQFRITGKKDDYKAIGDKLAPEYQQHFYESLGRPEFRDMKKAVDASGRTIVECLDEERMRKFLTDNGYEEAPKGREKGVVYEAKKGKKGKKRK